jgi:hypothetical protein
MPPTLAEVIDYPKTNRSMGGGQGVLLRRLREKASERVYCCLFSQQVHPIAPKPLQALVYIHSITPAACMRPAEAWRAPTGGSPYSFNI